MHPLLPGTWHVARGGQTYGPYTWEQIVEHTRGGRISRGDKLFDPRSGVWAKPSKIPGLLGPGGAATIPWGLAAVVMTAAVIVALLAVLFAWMLTPKEPLPGLGIADNPIEISFVTLPTVPPGTTPATVPSGTTPPTGLTAPEGLTFKGTYRSEWKERDAPGGSLWSDGPCYLWIFTTESGTVASFDFLENIGDPTWDGRDWLPLVSHTGSHYVFESSSLTLVDKWRLVVDVTDTGMSGTVTNITPEIGTFIRGDFSGQSITYEQYQAEAPS